MMMMLPCHIMILKIKSPRRLCRPIDEISIHLSSQNHFSRGWTSDSASSEPMDDGAVSLRISLLQQRHRPPLLGPRFTLHFSLPLIPGLLSILFLFHFISQRPTQAKKYTCKVFIAHPLTQKHTHGIRPMETDTGRNTQKTHAQSHTYTRTPTSGRILIVNFLLYIVYHLLMVFIFHPIFSSSRAGW